MPCEGSIIFYGVSGRAYQFEIYPANTVFNNVSAVYIFCIKYITGLQFKFSPLYIGETGELKTRIANHEKWTCVNNYGCTHICVMSILGEDARLAVEKDLRHNYFTPCNDQ